MKKGIDYITVDAYQHQPDYVSLVKKDRKNHLWATPEYEIMPQYTLYYYNGNIMRCSVFTSIPGNKFKLHHEEECQIEYLSPAIVEKFYRFSLLISPRTTLSMILKKFDIPLDIQNIIYNNGLIKELSPLYQVVSEKRMLPMFTTSHRQQNINNL